MAQLNVSNIVELIGQISIGVAILAVYALAARRVKPARPWMQQAVVGAVFGLQSIASLLLPVHLGHGVTITTAMASVGLGGLFGGWVGGAISVLLTTMGRFADSGPIIPALSRTVVAGAVGIGLHALSRRQHRKISGYDLAGLGILVVATSLASFAFAAPERQTVLVSEATIPLTVALLAGTLLLGSQFLSEQRRAELTEKLAASERRMRDIFNNLPGTVYQMRLNPDETLTYTFMSERVRDAVGARADAVLRRADLVDGTFLPEENEARWKFLRDSIETMKPGYREFRMRHPDGSLRWMRTYSTPQRGPDGLISWTGFTIDITTERAQAEALRRSTDDLAASEQQLRGITASVPGIVYRISHDANGKVRYHFVSDGIKSICGLNPQDVLKDSGLVLGMYLPEDEDSRVRVFQESADTMSMRERKFRIRHPDGSIRWLHSRSTPHRDPSGEIVWDGVTLDITGQVTLEEELRRSLRAHAASEERLRAIIRAIPGVVYQIRYQADGSSSYTFLSDGVKEVLGYSAEEVLADQSILARTRIPEEEPGRVTSAQESAATMSLREREFRGHHVDGTVHWYLSRSMPHLDSSGAVVFDGITMDITDRKKLEEELRRTEHLSALAGLVDGVAHNFNNLLQIIAGGAELLREEAGGNPGQRTITDQILSATDRGARLITDLRRFSRNQPATGDKANVNALLRDLEELSGSFVGSSTSIKFQPGAGVWAAAAAPARVQTAVLGLILNARDALPEGGHIRMETSNRTVSDPEARATGGKPGSYVEILVGDDGTGMTPEVLRRATEPFFTTAPAKRPGLGLSAINSFVHQHGGRLTISSTVGEGTEVRILLPAAGQAV